MARTRVCVLPWNRSQLSVPVGAFHKRRIPATSDSRRPTTKPTRRSIGGANGGIRPSPLPIAKIVFEGAPEQRRPAKFRVAFSLRGRLLPLLALPSSPPFTRRRDTSNVKSTFESACSRFVSPRFPKKGKTAWKDRGDRIWPPRETSWSDYWLCKKKEAADILLFPSRPRVLFSSSMEKIFSSFSISRRSVRHAK